MVPTRLNWSCYLFTITIAGLKETGHISVLLRIKKKKKRVEEHSKIKSSLSFNTHS